MAFLQGKKILITGLLSNRSIAYGIAQACKREGAELAFTYVGERFKDRITEFAAEFGSNLVFDCDVGSDEQINALFADLGKSWDRLDGLVHAIGFAPREAIAGEFLDGLTRENFRIAHDISAYSFPAMAKAALPLLKEGSSVLTLSYLGAVRAIPYYNTMGLAKASLEASVRYLAENLGKLGIRSNGISAGPIKTWPPPASRTSASCWALPRRTRHCAATSPSKKSATPPPSCCPTWPRASPVKSPTSMAASRT
jgi:enoyl-[acyl-carrier protein] reductase I